MADRDRQRLVTLDRFLELTGERKMSEGMKQGEVRNVMITFISSEEACGT